MVILTFNQFGRLNMVCFLGEKNGYIESVSRYVVDVCDIWGKGGGIGVAVA